MSELTTAFFILAVVLIAAAPYTMRIHHPRQKPLAAYLIFIFMFFIVSAVLYSTLGWLAVRFELGPLLDSAGSAIAFLALIFVPAFLLARWLARKPPWHSNVPH